MALPDADKPFRVVCVASNFAIGGPPIKTDDDSIDRVILYQARLLKTTEIDYPVQRATFYKVCYCEVSCAPIGNEPFVAYTDHASLRTAINSPHLLPLMSWWLTVFSELSFSSQTQAGEVEFLG